MTEEEFKMLIKIKDRHEYFTRDDRFEKRNLFEKECLFEIGYLTQIIEKLQKENEELRQNNDTATTKTEEQKEIYKKQEDLSLEDEPYFTDIF